LGNESVGGWAVFPLFLFSPLGKHHEVSPTAFLTEQQPNSSSAEAQMHSVSNRTPPVTRGCLLEATERKPTIVVWRPSLKCIIVPRLKTIGQTPFEIITFAVVTILKSFVMDHI